MRALLISCLALALVAVIGGQGRSGEERAVVSSLPDTVISVIAQDFVTRHHGRDGADKPRLSFQDAEVYPQDDPGKWAVLGGYMAFAGGKDPQAHAYGLTMVLTCPRHDDPKCWRLEKLLIDKELVVDR